MGGEMGKRLLPLLSALLLVLFVYESAGRIVLAPFVELPDFTGGLFGQTLLLVAFSLVHSLGSLGWRHTLVFFAATAVVSWCFEQLGVATGIVYGHYHYTAVLGWKLGHVPVLIPLAWYMMIYPSYVIATILASGASPSRGRGRVLGPAFLGAMIMTAWDLVVDPLLSGPAVKAWVWEQGGPYFGIPLRNFLGWMITTFVVYVLYGLFAAGARRKHQPSGGRIMESLPLVAFASVMISNSLANDRKEMVVIGLLAMGIPLAAAILRRDAVS
jgi:uncharacterized membrane protein